MKKLSLVFVALACFSLTGLTGCGGSGETQVIQNSGEDISGISDEQKKQIEEEMQAGGGYSGQGSN